MRRMSKAVMVAVSIVGLVTAVSMAVWLAVRHARWFVVRSHYDALVLSVSNKGGLA